MLKSLQIKNFALIESLEIDFREGLSIITGETGAGKSILIDALMLALGERASIDSIRYGEKKAIVEALFTVESSHPVMSILDEQELDHEDNELLLRRELNIKGNSRAFVNDTPVPVSLLKKFGDILVDFHGQHDHQSLLRPETHIGIVDHIAGDEALLKEYSEKYTQLKALLDELEKTRNREKSLKSEAESKRRMLGEIRSVDPKKNEIDDINSELNIIENSELLFNNARQIYTLLYEGEDAVHNKLTEIKDILSSLAGIDKQFNTYFEELTTALISIDEIAKFANDYSSGIHYDPDQIEQLRLRLLELKGLQKKFGPLEQIFSEMEQLEKDLRLIENFDGEIARLEKEIEALRSDMGSVAKKLSGLRKKTSGTIENDVQNILKAMGIENAMFRIKSDNELLKPPYSDNGMSLSIGDEYYKAYPDGMDLIEFYISLNKGEIPKPLADIASGGEISRIMLSIKSIAAESDKMPMLIFDEIDTGISGRIAQKVGIVMKNLARQHQIIAITHLPQIAALADHNYSVKKEEGAERTSVQVDQLNKDDKIREVARLLSGEDVSRASLDSARELSEIEIVLD